jgi:hypothetical protein
LQEKSNSGKLPGRQSAPKPVDQHSLINLGRTSPTLTPFRHTDRVFLRNLFTITRNRGEVKLFPPRGTFSIKMLVPHTRHCHPERSAAKSKDLRLLSFYVRKFSRFVTGYDSNRVVSSAKSMRALVPEGCFSSVSTFTIGC